MITQGGGAAVGNNLEQTLHAGLGHQERRFLAHTKLEDQLLWFPAHLSSTLIQACAWWLSAWIPRKIPHHSLSRLELLTKRGEECSSCCCTWALSQNEGEEGERIRAEDWHFIIPSLLSGLNKWFGQMFAAGRAHWALILSNVYLWSRCISKNRFESMNRFHSYI